MSDSVLRWDTLRESIAMAISAVKSNKLRSILTLIGIAVGIFSIIIVMTAMAVMENSIEEGMTQLGANTFQMQRFPATIGGGPRFRFRNRKIITYEQALAVRDRATLAEAVGIECWTGGKIVFWNGQRTNPNVQLVGENLEGITTNDWTVEAGRSFSAGDVDLARPVAILGAPVAEKLFPPRVDPVGQTVRVDGRVYSVIGVFKKKGGALGGNQDNFIAVPITSFFQVYGKADTDIHIMVKAQSKEVMDDAVEQSRMILRAARHVPPGADDDFGYFSNDSLIKEFNELTLIFRMVVLAVSSIALVAAGVGIMNIMLVSVTERTREIGIRKSIGAQKKDILSQFMVEAVILCELGGIAGILLGVLGGNILSLVMGVPTVIPWDWVGIGLVTCSMVGLVFGIYPAWKAANLDPIDALRYE
jgi:putative ABC transport system permease protein